MQRTWLLSLTLLGLLGCDTDLAGSDANSNGPGTSSSGGASSSGGSAATLSLRFAHASPDAPAIDVCVAKNGEGFAGARPFLAAQGLRAGLTYAQVSTFGATPFAPTGKLDLRLIAAGASDCSAGVTPDQTVEILDDEAVTIVLTGLLADNPAPKLLVTTSFLRAPKSDHCTTNFVHAAVGLGAVVADYVKDGRSVSGWGDLSIPFADDTGYIDTDPDAAPVALRIQSNGSTTTFTAPDLSLDAAETSIAFVLGHVGGTKPLSGLYCRDQRVDAGLTQCVTLTASP